MNIVYIAGPFRGHTPWDIEQNIRRAEELALECWRHGYAVVCPHTNTRFFHRAAPDSSFLEGDLSIMKRCDAVLMVEGWERSAGAREEERVARERNIPVFLTLKGLVEGYATGEGHK